MKTIILSSYDGMYQGSLFIIANDGTVIEPKANIEDLRKLNNNKELGYYCYDLDKLQNLLLESDIQIEIGDRIVFIDDGIVCENTLIQNLPQIEKLLLDMME